MKTYCNIAYNYKRSKVLLRFSYISILNMAVYPLSEGVDG